jgi:hypothetical protein
MKTYKEWTKAFDTAFVIDLAFMEKVQAQWGA